MRTILAYINSLILVALLATVVMPAFSQTVKAIEYFYDSDPGVGNGTRINLTPSAQADITVTCNMSSLSLGLHRLYVRALDNDDQWSLYHSYPVFKGENSQPVVVSKLEYFFDADPGVGRGIPVDLSKLPMVDMTVNLDMSSVTQGLHQVYIRAMDNAGKWSLYHSYPVFKGENSQPVVVSKLEYFFDADPGVGGGTPVDLSKLPIADMTVNIDLNSISEGLHQLYVRVMDNTGRWSLYNSYPVIKGPGYYQPLVVQQMEFFIDIDPGVGKAIPIPVHQGRIIDSTFLLQLPNSNKDTVHLFVRAMDNRGMWGLYHDTVIAVTCALYKFKPGFNFTPSSFCTNTPVQFTDSSLTQQQWHWRFGTGDSSRVQNPVYKYSTAGNYEVSLYVVNARGCVSDTNKKTVTVAAPPTVNAGPDLDVFIGEQVTLHPSASAGVIKYSWSPGTYMSSTTISAPVITGTDNIMYRLTVTDANGCTASDSLQVKVVKENRELRVPNIFTPNNDGINDLWVITHLNTYRDCRVQVFNRYGQKLFESIGYGTPWDGRYNGQPLPFGTYYYIIEPGKGIKPLTGYVTIIR